MLEGGEDIFHAVVRLSAQTREERVLLFGSIKI